MAPAPPTAPADGGGGSAARAVTAFVALFVLIALAVKIFDVKRKRFAERVHLEAQISDALISEAALSGLALAPSARVPFLGKSPVTIQVAGQIPSPELRETVMRIVQREASRIRRDVRVEDHMIVGTGTRAAS